jgi:hypothetical protein
VTTAPEALALLRRLAGRGLGTLEEPRKGRLIFTLKTWGSEEGSEMRTQRKEKTHATERQKRRK